MANGAQKVAMAAGFTHIAWPTKPCEGEDRRARPRCSLGEPLWSPVMELDPERDRAVLRRQRDVAGPDRCRIALRLE
jgi:hypothetical protein